MKTTNSVAWIVFIFLAISVGLYPLIYLFADETFGLLATKSNVLLANVFWKIGFYGHILFGGFALLTGWAQFSQKMRTANLGRHRFLGKIYIIAASISGTCGFFIAFAATGGWIASAGFMALAVIWLFTSLTAYSAIKKRDLPLHQGMMVYSYAACFAAVTLRVWLPLLTLTLQDFILAYRMVAWLCWVPNLVFAYFWVRKKGLVLG